MEKVTSKELLNDELFKLLRQTEVSVDQVSRLLKDGADPNALNSEKRTPLIIAAWGGREDLVKCLITCGAHVKIPGPLHSAAAAGHTEVVKLLIKEKANVHARKNGYTPLDRAAWNGRKAVVELLIAFDADMYAVDKDGRTPYRSAEVKKHSEVMEVLRARQAYLAKKFFEETSTGVNDVFKGGAVPSDTLSADSWNHLDKAIREGNQGKVKYLVAHGADVNTPVGSLYTPLHKAIMKGQKEIVKILLAHGAAVNAAHNFDGDTPLHTAVAYSYTEIVEVLLAYGGDVNAINRDGWTALHFAARHGCKGITEVLLAHGIYVDVVDSEGNTPLHVAVEYDYDGYWGSEHGSDRGNYNQLIEVLISKGAKVNARNNNGLTPLQLIIKKPAGETFPWIKNKKEIVKVLLSHDAAVNIVEERGGTPLHAAVELGDEESVRMLINKDAKIWVRDNQGTTPLHIAFQELGNVSNGEGNYEKICRILISNLIFMPDSGDKALVESHLRMNNAFIEQVYRYTIEQIKRALKEIDRQLSAARSNDFFYTRPREVILLLNLDNLEENFGKVIRQNIGFRLGFKDGGNPQDSNEVAVL